MIDYSRLSVGRRGEEGGKGVRIEEEEEGEGKAGREGGRKERGEREESPIQPTDSISTRTSSLETRLSSKFTSTRVEES